MSSPFAYLAAATRKARREANKCMKDYYSRVLDDTFLQSLGTYNDAYMHFYKIECRNAVEDIKYMKIMKDAIQDDLEELLGIEPKEVPGFFITIRPDDTKCNFIDFKDKCLKLVQRTCFKEYALSFEQKGTSPEDLGKGFHCHIVAKMKQRSKGEALRDITSSFKTWIDQGMIAPNCIDVCITKNPEELVNRYLIAYDSDDEHKALTKSWDDLWRQHNEVLPLYAQKLLTPP